MSPSTLPKIPTVRLAIPSDLARMGTVTIAGFHPSQSFKYNQPHYSSHPLSALRSSRNYYKSTMMSSTDYILLVIEDEYNPAENLYCPDISVTGEANEQLPAAGEKVVVGVAVYQLPRGSTRLGDFQNTKAIEVNLPLPESTEDLDFWHYMTYTKKTAAVMDSHFTNSLFLSTLTVHPAYSRRGHGANLTRWGIQLVRMDGLELGLVASEFGNKMYKRLGFEFMERLLIQGDEVSPMGVDGEVLRWKGGCCNMKGKKGKETAKNAEAFLEELVSAMLRLRI